MKSSRTPSVLAVAAVLALALTSSMAAAQAPAPSSPAAATAPQAALPGETLIGTGPNGATMRCRDGSYPSPDAAASACDSKGGLLVRFPVRRVPAPASARPARLPAPAMPAPVASPAESAPTGETFQMRANVFVPAERAPAGATLQCVDGTFIVADTTRARCATRGGVRVTFPAKPKG